MNRKQRRAAAKLGSPPIQLLATAMRFHQAGQLAAAEACYRQVLAAQPNLADAHNNLGNALAAQGKLDEAIAAYRQTIIINSNYAEAHFNLGRVASDHSSANIDARTPGHGEGGYKYQCRSLSPGSSFGLHGRRSPSCAPSDAAGTW